ncbi:hypothetical protein E4U42_000051 [Claviceps africana]|uniref:Uncharacterized protein n=1 Tax=Claviceps africana TaxID=83212 RepID=A0A8K0NNE1_9HYPO|nr:hypothetical protein E4U42_000051 [Claviceps africana]
MYLLTPAYGVVAQPEASVARDFLSPKLPQPEASLAEAPSARNFVNYIVHPANAFTMQSAGLPNCEQKCVNEFDDPSQWPACVRKCTHG